MKIESSIPRLRVIAGPNGSGKSSYYDVLKTLVDTGAWINADELNSQLTTNGYIDLDKLNFHPGRKHWKSFIQLKSSQSFIELFGLKDVVESLQVGEFIISAGLIGADNNTIAALLADFFRYALVRQKLKFTTETVFSHPSKIHLVKDAIKKHYKTYLYFICTESPFLNIERVKSRKAKGGHDVSADKVVARYHKTISLLSEIIPLFDRVYLFDNSLFEHQLIASIKKGELEQYYVTTIPAWVEKVLNKI